MTIAMADCGRCFFLSRKFYIDPSCAVHIDQTTSKTKFICCITCGLPEAAELIDAKPSDGDYEHGDYDKCECISCYGPGYSMLSWDHISLSIRPELAGLYRFYIEPRRLKDIVWC